MVNTINPEQALHQAFVAQVAALQQVFADQVTAYGPQALDVLHNTIQPWWQAFVPSTTGARLGWLLGSGQLDRAAITHPVKYRRADGLDWTAVAQIEGSPRHMKLVIAQFRHGQRPRSWAGAMFAHSQRRTLPTAPLSEYTLDLHPIVLIDFARQIEGHLVDAAVDIQVRAGETRPPAAYREV